MLVDWQAFHIQTHCHPKVNAEFLVVSLRRHVILVDGQAGHMEIVIPRFNPYHDQTSMLTSRLFVGRHSD